MECDEYPDYCRFLLSRAAPPEGSSGATPSAACDIKRGPHDADDDAPRFRWMLVDDNGNAVGVVAEASHMAFRFEQPVPVESIAAEILDLAPPRQKLRADHPLLGAPVLPKLWVDWWLGKLAKSVRPPATPFSTALRQATHGTPCPAPLVWSALHHRCLPTSSPLLNAAIGSRTAPTAPAPPPPANTPPAPPLAPDASGAPDAPPLAPDAPPVAPDAPPYAPPDAPPAPDAPPMAPDAPPTPGAPAVARVVAPVKPKDCFQLLEAELKVPWPNWSPENKEKYHNCVMQRFQDAWARNEKSIKEHLTDKLKEHDAEVDKLKTALIGAQNSYRAELLRLREIDKTSMPTLWNKQAETVADRYSRLDALVKVAKIRLVDEEAAFRVRLSQLGLCSFVKPKLTANVKEKKLREYMVQDCKLDMANPNTFIASKGGPLVNTDTREMHPERAIVTKCCDATELQTYPPEPFPYQMPSPHAFAGCPASAITPSLLVNPVRSHDGKSILLADYECDPCASIAKDSKGQPVYRRIGDRCVRRDFAERIGAYIGGYLVQTNDQKNGWWKVDGTTLTWKPEDLYAIRTAERALASGVKTLASRIPSLQQQIADIKKRTARAVTSTALNLQKNVMCEHPDEGSLNTDTGHCEQDADKLKAKAENEEKAKAEREAKKKADEEKKAAQAKQEASEPTKPVNLPPPVPNYFEQNYVPWTATSASKRPPTWMPPPIEAKNSKDDKPDSDKRQATTLEGIANRGLPRMIAMLAEKVKQGDDLLKNSPELKSLKDLADVEAPPEGVLSKIQPSVPPPRKVELKLAAPKVVLNESTENNNNQATLMMARLNPLRHQSDSTRPITTPSVAPETKGAPSSVGTERRVYTAPRKEKETLKLPTLPTYLQSHVSPTANNEGEWEKEGGATTFRQFPVVGPRMDERRRWFSTSGQFGLVQPVVTPSIRPPFWGHPGSFKPTLRPHPISTRPHPAQFGRRGGASLSDCLLNPAKCSAAVSGATAESKGQMRHVVGCAPSAFVGQPEDGRAAVCRPPAGVTYPYVLLNKEGQITAAVRADGSRRFLERPVPVPDTGLPANAVVGIATADEVAALLPNRALTESDRLPANETKALMDGFAHLPNCMPHLCDAASTSGESDGVYDPATQTCLRTSLRSDTAYKPTKTGGQTGSKDMAVIRAINQRLRSPAPTESWLTRPVNTAINQRLSSPQPSLNKPMSASDSPFMTEPWLNRPAAERLLLTREPTTKSMPPSGLSPATIAHPTPIPIQIGSRPSNLVHRLATMQAARLKPSLRSSTLNSLGNSPQWIPDESYVFQSSPHYTGLA